MHHNCIGQWERHFPYAAARGPGFAKPVTLSVPLKDFALFICHNIASTINRYTEKTKETLYEIIMIIMESIS